MKEREFPKPGEFYCHFKKKYYQILTIATHSETRELLVIYQALYDDFSVYARPMNMFLSEVDKEKYPGVVQKYRFERVNRPGVSVVSSECFDSKVTIDVHTREKASKESSEEKQLVELEEEKAVIEKAEAIVLDEDVERFLDAGTYKEKLDILMSLRNHITDKQLHDMAITLDITIDEGDIENKFQNLVQCLRTMARFEIDR